MARKYSRILELFHKYHEIIMYCVFGVTTTIVSWLVYSLCEKTLPFDTVVQMTFFNRIFIFKLKLLAAGAISWIIAVAVAFVTNKLWVFNSKSWEKRLVTREAISFVGGRAVTGALEIVSVPALESWGLNMTLFGIEGLPAKMLVSITIVILNYILSKFFAFDSGEKKT